MTKLNTLLDSTHGEKIDAIKKAIGGKMRNVFDDRVKAVAAFTKAQSEAGDAVPAFAADDSAFGDGVNTAVAVVGARVRDAKGKMQSGIKAVVSFPMPTAAAFIESAPDWVAKIIEKEAAHVAFRALRNAESMEELEAAAKQMPLTVEDYVAEHARGGDGLDTDTFDAVWNPLRKMLKENMPALVDLLPQKGEVLKSIRSKSYAESEHEALESRGVFVYLGNLIVQAAEGWTDGDGQPAPLDAEPVKAWLEGRDSLNIKKAEAREKDFSALDSLDLGFGNEADEEEEAGEDAA